ncbi:VanW family protein [Clostridium saccharoperbutylacetonicum]|uniref:VanW family protein n=1 Tax=Clostridium saccharoperbutylacetonicum TaxID=36745 RepID=UPI000983FD07|nr:VanW family protein [Clostridium saccharoperbutylacetonicum]AQR97548.1 vancomycin B-type resistance protein VanW [Clostridium saccharoperbutylacetonicum]NSB33432.1 vancomycin resistance protein YoaR [Clostridium saccharoperbutylacetonicum]
MEKRTGKRAKSSRRKSNAKKKVMLAISALAVIGIAALVGFNLVAKGTVKEWENKIYPGVTVQGTDLGGMTKEEAKNKLIETFETAIGKKKLNIEIGDKHYELIYSDIIPKYDIDGTVEQAYSIGKENGLFKKYMTIKNGENAKNEISLGFSYDEEKLKAYEKKLQNEVGESPKDATVSIDKNNIVVKPETEGKTINLENLDSKLKENINGKLDAGDPVNVDVEITKPKITKEDLSKIKNLMGTFSTNYGSSAPGRSNNIEIATSAINGTVVMPGEVFSFNDVVGPRTVERGYQEAGTYVGNKVEPGIGGGICQVSTTLYRAVMKANLRSIERTNHSMVVGYAQPGLDATVSYGYLDYKFKNVYDFPIYIQGTTVGKVVTYSIYGDSSALNGKTYDMANEILATIPPETKVVPDNTLPEGKEVKDGAGMTGYQARSYQITYENGVEVNREIVATDTYASVGIVVRKGTQPAANSAAATPPPATVQPIAPPPVAQPAQ